MPIDTDDLTAAVPNAIGAATANTWSLLLAEPAPSMWITSLDPTHRKLVDSAIETLAEARTGETNHLGLTRRRLRLRPRFVATLAAVQAPPMNGATC